MSRLSLITSTFFVDLITRLGVRPPPDEGFLLSNIVQPVSLVDSGVTLTSVATTMLLDVPFSNGPSVAPAANTILADTLAQNAGDYFVVIWAGFFDSTAGPVIQIERRDAANAANIWTQRLAGNSNNFYFQGKVRLSQSERLRCQNIAAGGAGSQFQVNIWLTPA